MRGKNRRMGRVVKLTDKGYGFIMEDGLGNVFFHQSQLVSANFKDLTVGAILEYQVKEIEGKRPEANRILVVQDYRTEKEDARTTNKKKKRR
ncbi:cold-shock protein [Proteiniclasticum sp. C24MP]|uniref:cold-shock protein n=1 Tax=Proteiniclasticum sp. C24MP TaxID=3374101 RepID=UPI003753F0C8